jgi:epoxyqueuosine reductase
MSPSSQSLSHLVKERARAMGFDAVGITDLAPVPHADALRRWLERGMAGSMSYMHRQAGQRLEPDSILPGSTRAVVVACNYYQPDAPIPPGRGKVARYARGADYHRSLAQPLHELARYIESLGAPGTVARAYVDAGPVPERELAQRAGLGWIGKNTMLIDPHRGSFFFLATVLTSLPLAVDAPFEADRCGTCHRCLECLDACPTGAFPEERVLDSRACISYLTIEHQGDIPESRQAGMDGWVFGCDICQDVCPWNVSFATEPAHHLLEPDPALAALDLAAVEVASDEELERRFGHTALERPGVDGLRRNARIVRRNQAGRKRAAHSQ